MKSMRVVVYNEVSLEQAKVSYPEAVIYKTNSHEEALSMRVSLHNDYPDAEIFIYSHHVQTEHVSDLSDDEEDLDSSVATSKRYQQVKYPSKAGCRFAN